MAKKESAEATVRNIRRKTRKKYCVEEKIRIALEGLMGKLEQIDSCQCIIKNDRASHNFRS